MYRAYYRRFNRAHATPVEGRRKGLGTELNRKQSEAGRDYCFDLDQGSELAPSVF